MNAPNPFSSRLNILFLMTDQQRFDAVGYVNPQVITPHLDRLADGSLVFTRAYAASPSCIPSRASIYTGQYPSQCGCPTYASRLPETGVTFMSRLQDAGYHTAVTGKQHFHGSKIRRGYDEEEIIDVHGLMALREKLPAPAGESASALSSFEAFCVEQGIRSESDVMDRNDLPMSGTWKAADMRCHVDQYVGEKGREWIEHRQPTDRPWYLCVSFPGPHNPYDCDGTPYAGRYDLDRIDLPATGESDRAGKPPHFERYKPHHLVTDPVKVRRMRRSYYANVTLIDEKIGEILTALKRSGAYDNTLILFSTDHGDFQGDFGFAAKGQYLCEALMRVPLLVKPPVADFAGRSCDELVSLVDLASTCLRAAGVPSPPEMSGGNFLAPLQENVPYPRRDHLFFEAGSLKGVRTENWKLVYYLDRPYGELYHLQVDPWEKQNLWDAPEHAAIRDELKSLLISELIRLTPGWQTPWSSESFPPI